VHSVTSNHPWYVLRSEPRAEKQVAKRLQIKRLSHWLPLYTTRRRWSDRWKTVTLPLFPGYLFAGGDGTQLDEILSTPGVLTVVKNGAVPVELSAEYVARLKAVVEDPFLEVEPVSEPEPILQGEEVVVHEGVLAGFRGTVRAEQGRNRLVVWLPLVGHGIAVTIGRHMVTRPSQ
jgi:transcription termination/antitermination protein NusG